MTDEIARVSIEVRLSADSEVVTALTALASAIKDASATLSRSNMESGKLVAESNQQIANAQSGLAHVMKHRR